MHDKKTLSNKRRRTWLAPTGEPEPKSEREARAELIHKLSCLPPGTLGVLPKPMLTKPDKSE